MLVKMDQISTCASESHHSMKFLCLYILCACPLHCYFCTGPLNWWLMSSGCGAYFHMKVNLLWVLFPLFQDFSVLFKKGSFLLFVFSYMPACCPTRKAILVRMRVRCTWKCNQWPDVNCGALREAFFTFDSLWPVSFHTSTLNLGVLDSINHSSLLTCGALVCFSEHSISIR